MKPRRALLLLAIFIACRCPVRAQQYSDSDWAELRRRLAQGVDTAGLLRQPPRQPTISRRAMWRPSPDWSLLDERRQFVRRVACENMVRPAIALGIIDAESAFDQKAVGEFGELGVGQILPSTADEFGFDRERLRSDFEYNVHAAITIMRNLLERFSETDMVRAYNGGGGFPSSPPHVQEKIRRYVARVREREERYEGIGCG